MTMAEITRKMAARFKGGREGAPPAPVSAMVLFLDIDGVICTTLSTCLSALLRLPLERQIFDPLALFWLRRLVRRTGAEIVLCSSWRDALEADDPLCRAFIANLYEALARNGTPIADAAPRLPSGNKGEEILAWLAERPGVRYVILDDHDRFVPEVRGRWVPVPENRGLRRKQARAALKLFFEEHGTAEQAADPRER